MSVSISEVEFVFEDVVEDVLNSSNNSVGSRSGINDGFCSIVAAEVFERLGEPSDVRLCKDAEDEHYWLECDGSFFDAERTGGVEDWRELPYWSRHRVPSDGMEYGSWVKHTGF